MERKVLISTDAMSGDFVIILTDAPRERIEKWCSNYLAEQEEGLNTYFDSLKIDWMVKVLADSEDGFDRDDIEVIGYDEAYDVNDYSAKSAGVLRTYDEIYSHVKTLYEKCDTELNELFFNVMVSASADILLKVYAAIMDEINGDKVCCLSPLVTRVNGHVTTVYGEPVQRVEAGYFTGNFKDFLRSYSSQEYVTGWCRICGEGITVEDNFISGQLLSFVF